MITSSPALEGLGADTIVGTSGRAPDEPTPATVPATTIATAANTDKNQRCTPTLKCNRLNLQLKCRAGGGQCVRIWLHVGAESERRPVALLPVVQPDIERGYRNAALDRKLRGSALQ